MPELDSVAAGKHIIREHLLLVIVFLVFGLASAIYCIGFPQHAIWGDEFEYLKASNTPPAIDGYISKQIPGAMPYYWWPPFTSVFYSVFSTDSLQEFYLEHPASRRKILNEPQSHFLRRTTVVNVILLGASGFLLYCISIICGLGKSWSSLAVALTLLNPRILFYEQALWPEILHLALFCSAILLLLLFIQKRSTGLLVISSLFFSYASFTKGVTGIYVIFLSILLFYYYSKLFDFSKALKCTAALLVPFLLLTNAQKLRNFLDHDHYSIASNTWINIEAGLIPPEEITADGYRVIYERYQKAAKTPYEKERQSRIRTTEFLSSADIASVIKHQFKNYYRLINHSFLDEGIEKNRWIKSRRLESVLLVKNVMVWLCVVAGIIGMCRFAFRNIYCGVLALFLAYYLSALLIIGFNVRLIIQALPFLAIFCCFILKSTFEMFKGSTTRA